MARVEWSRHSGDDVELAIAIMLSRDNKGAMRIKPSRGDKGIDILVPVEGGYEVYQVKSYTGEIDRTRKRHIKQSWKRLNQYVEESSLNVTAWHLAMPEDATIPNLSWLAELTEGAAFSCDWRGLNFVDGLAAKYPDVIDYYFRDGKDRLEGTLRGFMSITNLGTASQGHVPASLAVPTLQALHTTVNSIDPHYYYDLAIETLTEGEPPPHPHIRPMMVVAQVAIIGSQCITVTVIARYIDAIKDRPVPINVRLDLSQYPEAREQLQQMMDYGTSFQSPAGVASGTLDLPGGLGGSYEGMTVRFGSSHSGNTGPFNLRLQVNDEDGSVLATALAYMERPTVGVTGTQHRSTGREQHGAFICETLFDSQTGKFSINFNPADLTGTHPAKVRDGLLFASLLKHPNTLQVGTEFGPIGRERSPLSASADLSFTFECIQQVLGALATIQEHTNVEIRTPDLTATHIETTREWLRAAALLRGQQIEATWTTPLVIQIPGGGSDLVTIDFEVSTLVLEEPLIVEIGEVQVPLGAKLTQIPGARLVEAHSDIDDHVVTVTYEPSDSDIVTIRLKRDDNVLAAGPV
jgi:hypothetical protein